MHSNEPTTPELTPETAEDVIQEAPSPPASRRPIVAIVGRPNVGKSTFFNRILRRRHAIVDDRPGVTRDRLYAGSDWNGRLFDIVDTGGIVPDATLPMDQQVNFQVEQAVQSADLVVLIVDGRVPITHTDEMVARILRESGRPVLLAVNKIDYPEAATEAPAYWSLGMGTPHPVSAAHGLGVGDFLDAVVAKLPDEARVGRVHPVGVPRVAIVGRPNVGKSSLLNQFAGEETAIVSATPGTTRDAVDTLVEIDGHRFLFIDTAGLRRRGRIKRGVEHFSALRTMAAVDRAEIVLLVVDVGEGITAQDIHVASFVAGSGRAVIFVANKWDLADRDPRYGKVFEEELRRRFHFFPQAPVERVSALSGRRVGKLPEAIRRIHERYHLRIPTAEFNAAVESALRRNPPPAVKGKDVRVLYATQVSSGPQRFVFFVNTRLPVPESYRRYLANRLREDFGFDGIPLTIQIRYRGEKKKGRT